LRSARCAAPDRRHARRRLSRAAPEHAGPACEGDCPRSGRPSARRPCHGSSGVHDAHFGLQRHAVRSSTRARTRSAIRCRSARRALGIDDEVGVLPDTRAPPRSRPFSPQASISRAAWSPAGLRNTLPALGKESGCEAMRFSSSSLMRAREAVPSPLRRSNQAPANHSSAPRRPPTLSEQWR
jgi:hypothetical protein